MRTADELRTQEVLELVDQLVDAGVVDLGVSGGEPLLRPDLFQILAYAKRRGLCVGVGSNGGYLSVIQAETLARLRVDRFQVSLDGFEAAHDALRLWPGLFQRVLKTIQVARSAGLRVHVCCTINRLDAAELEAFARFVSTLDVQRINFSRYIPTGRGTDALDLTVREWRSIVHLVTRLRDELGGRPEIVSHLAQQVLVDQDVVNVPGFAGCQAGIGQGCVTANGTVLPCVLLPVSVGNVRAKPFRDIWLESRTIQILQRREGLKGRCGSCALRGLCGGCRAVAYAKTGDYLAADPRCWIETPLDAAVPCRPGVEACVVP